MQASHEREIRRLTETNEDMVSYMFYINFMFHAYFMHNSVQVVKMKQIQIDVKAKKSQIDRV